jgi:uncharacterized protein DUF6519/parallel beta helix pectate lyase-like protein
VPADFSRNRTNPLRDYASVQLEQGAVLLDADANEGADIVDRRLRALAIDTLGRATVSQTTPDAFKVTPVTNEVPDTFLIGKGRMYVDGLLAENHGAPSSPLTLDPLLAEPTFSDGVRYDQQPYLPNAPDLPVSGRHVVYLDVWQREVTHLQAPDLVEVAVGVEASSRVQTVWQVRALELPEGSAVSCSTPDAQVPGWSQLTEPSTGLLTTGTFEIAAGDDPCELPPTGGYRGLENQLYRVQIHNPGKDGTATFKWSRENASVGSAVASIVSSDDPAYTVLELETLGRDEVLSFKTGDWVEILDDPRELSQQPGEMRQIIIDDPSTRRIRCSPPLPPDLLLALPKPAERHLRVYRWDQAGQIFQTGPGGTLEPYQDLDEPGPDPDPLAPPAPRGVIRLPPFGVVLLLERGLTVRFDFRSSDFGGVKSGDYWVFAARTAEPSVERLDRAPPRGVHHHFARLAVWALGDLGGVTDCRTLWPPGDDCSCTVCVTPSSHQSGQLTIQAAIEQVKRTGGIVCLGPGEYALHEPLRVEQAQSVIVRGQSRGHLESFLDSSRGTVLIGSQNPGQQGAFLLQDSIDVCIEHIALRSFGDAPAVSVLNAARVELRALDILLTGEGAGPGISVAGFIDELAICACKLLARFGVVSGSVARDGELEPTLTALGSLQIEDNLLLCDDRGISMSNILPIARGSEAAPAAFNIERNRIEGCSEMGIQMAGEPVARSSCQILRNVLHVRGDGICGFLEGLRIEGNEVGAVGELERLRVGIDVGPTDRCLALANRVQGFDIGIQAGDARDLEVNGNVVTDCSTGIFAVSSSLNESAMVLQDNRLDNIEQVGLLVQSHSAKLTGNSLRIAGTVADDEGAIVVGIFVSNVRHATLSDNDVSVDVSARARASFGMLFMPPSADFVVRQNRVRRGPGPERLFGFFALTVATSISSATEPAATPIVKAGPLTFIGLDALRTLILNDRRSHVLTTLEPTVQRGSVLGNAFLMSSTGDTAVDVTCTECVFSDNRIEYPLPTSGPISALKLRTQVAIVSSNFLAGGGVPAFSITAQGFTVLGNVIKGTFASFGIEVNGAEVGDPWDRLNILLR